MPRTVLGDVASWHRLDLATKPSHMGDRCGWASLPFALPPALICRGDRASRQVLPCPTMRHCVVAPFWGVQSP
jgi:hypothetical protein